VTLHAAWYTWPWPPRAWGHGGTAAAGETTSLGLKIRHRQPFVTGGRTGMSAPQASSWGQPSTAEPQNDLEKPLRDSSRNYSSRSLGSSQTGRTRASSDSGTKPFARSRSDSMTHSMMWSTASFHKSLTNRHEKEGWRASLLGSIVDGFIEPYDGGEGMGVTETCVNLVKCAAGCGMFSLPYAYKQGGLYLSIAGTIFFGLISAYTVTILAAAELKARSMGDAAQWSKVTPTSSVLAGRHSSGHRGSGSLENQIKANGGRPAKAPVPP
jgi:hypothetical protein